MHKIHFFPAHCVSKECHVGLQDSATFTAGWDLEITHLLIRQEDIPIWSHTKCFSLPGRIQSFKVLLKLRAQDLVSTGQAENPKIQSKIIMQSFMSAEDLESVTFSLEGLEGLLSLSMFIHQILQVKELSFYLQLLFCRNALEEVL